MNLNGNITLNVIYVKTSEMCGKSKCKIASRVTKKLGN